MSRAGHFIYIFLSLSRRDIRVNPIRCSTDYRMVRGEINRDSADKIAPQELAISQRSTERGSNSWRCASRLSSLIRTWLPRGKLPALRYLRERIVPENTANIVRPEKLQKFIKLCARPFRHPDINVVAEFTAKKQAVMKEICNIIQIFERL